MELDDGSAQRVPDYLETLIAAVHEYGDASARIVDEDDAVFALLNAAIVGPGSNPNSHCVQPYVQNGTVVRGTTKQIRTGLSTTIIALGETMIPTGAYGTCTPRR
jgi:hypothetical protein